MLSKDEKTNIITEYHTHETDTGSGNYADLMRSQPSAPVRSSGGGGRGGRGGGGGAAMGGSDSPEALRHWLTVHLTGSSTGTTK